MILRFSFLLATSFATSISDQGVGLASLHILVNTDRFVEYIRTRIGSVSSSADEGSELMIAINLANSLPDVTCEAYTLAVQEIHMHARNSIGYNLSLVSIQEGANALLNRLEPVPLAATPRGHQPDLFSFHMSSGQSEIAIPDNANAIHVIELDDSFRRRESFPQRLSISEPPRTYKLQGMISRNSDGEFYAQFTRNTQWYSTQRTGETVSITVPDYSGIYQAVFVHDLSDEEDDVRSDAETVLGDYPESPRVVDLDDESSTVQMIPSDDHRPTREVTRNEGGRRVVMTTTRAPRHRYHPYDDHRPTREAPRPSTTVSP